MTISQPPAVPSEVPPLRVVGMILRVALALVLSVVGAWIATGGFLWIALSTGLPGATAGVLEQLSALGIVGAAISIVLLGWRLLIPGWWRLAVVPVFAAGVWASLYCLGVSF